MIVLRQGRVLPFSTAQKGQSLFLLVGLRNGPISISRQFSHQRAAGGRALLTSPFVFKQQGRSQFSTLNVYRHPLGKIQIGNPIFSSLRPQIQFTQSPQLTASLSTAAQRILEQGESQSQPIDWTVEAANTVPQYGELAQFGLGITYWPSDILIRLLEFCHVSTQLPWWSSIVLVTVILRITLFPLVLKQTRNMAIIPYIIDEQKVLMEETNKARASGELVEMRRASTKLMSLYKQWGYSPFISFWGMLQIPVFFGMFRMCYRCSNVPGIGWEEGGTAWFTDLTQIDPYFILPAISGVTTALTIWLGQREITTEPKGMMGFLGAIMPIMAIAAIPILGAYQPASVFLYWTFNNLILFFQFLLFNNPRTRELLGIMPRLPPPKDAKPRTPGLAGFVQDRVDYIKLAFKNYLVAQDERRAAISLVARDAARGRRKKGKADTRATKAGAVEKLK